MNQKGDIHVTFKQGLFLIWSWSNVAPPSPGVWLPTNSSRDVAYIQDYLQANRMQKIQESSIAPDEKDYYHPLCGIYRPPAPMVEQVRAVRLG